MSRFKRWDKAVFRGDTEREEFEVTYVNEDGSVDLRTENDEWTYVPSRFLELVPRPVRVGEVYRGRITRDHYYVVPDEDGSAVISYKGRFVNTNPDELTDTDAFERVRDAL